MFHFLVWNWRRVWIHWSCFFFYVVMASIFFLSTFCSSKHFFFFHVLMESNFFIPSKFLSSHFDYIFRCLTFLESLFWLADLCRESSLRLQKLYQTPRIPSSHVTSWCRGYFRRPSSPWRQNTLGSYELLYHSRCS